MSSKSLCRKHEFIIQQQLISRPELSSSPSTTPERRPVKISFQKNYFLLCVPLYSEDFWKALRAFRADKKSAFNGTSLFHLRYKRRDSGILFFPVAFVFLFFPSKTNDLCARWRENTHIPDIFPFFDMKRVSFLSLSLFSFSRFDCSIHMQVSDNTYRGWLPRICLLRLLSSVSLIALLQSKWSEHWRLDQQILPSYLRVTSLFTLTSLAFSHRFFLTLSFFHCVRHGDGSEQIVQ